MTLMSSKSDISLTVQIEVNPLSQLPWKGTAFWTIVALLLQEGGVRDRTSIEISGIEKEESQEHLLSTRSDGCPAGSRSVDTEKNDRKGRVDCEASSDAGWLHTSAKTTNEEVSLCEGLARW
jgi:hypothetical protein